MVLAGILVREVDRMNLEASPVVDRMNLEGSPVVDYTNLVESPANRRGKQWPLRSHVSMTGMWHTRLVPEVLQAAWEVLHSEGH
mmetsp:Transcript_61032/g.137745  ORF Transcript_61032/g.137745 Transcript_61032/m.137745 type:complete len:84 (+) Transcript_61032:1214-1465(+)